MGRQGTYYGEVGTEKVRWGGRDRYSRWLEEVFRGSRDREREIEE